MSLLQNEDFKTEAQITGAGGSPSQLLNDTKIWVTGNSINKTLDDAIIDGDIGGGGSGINYITNNEFKTNDNGWVDYKDAAQVTPVDGVGGTPTANLFQRSTSSPLRGLASGLLAKPASNIRGEGTAYDFTIDTADQAKVLEVSFDYTVTANYADGHVRIYVYDVTNAQLIELSQRDLLANSGQASYKGYFQAASNSTSYRLIIHIATDSALAWDLKIDNVRVGPASGAGNAVFVSDWEGFTPNGTWTNTTYLGKYRRVGDTAEIEYYLTCTGSPTGNLTINLPSGLNIDTSKLNSFVGANYNLDSDGVYRDLSVGNYPLKARYSTTSAFTIRYYDDVAAGVAEAATFSATAPATVVSGDIVEMKIKVPIKGWSTGVSASEIPSSSVVAAKMKRTVNQTGVNPNNSDVKILLNTSIYDTSGAFDSANSRYIIPESGYYSIDGMVTTGSTNVLADGYSAAIYKNGSAIRYGDLYNGNVGTSLFRSVTCQEYFNKGDIIELYLYARGNHSVNTLTIAVPWTFLDISKISTPAIIAPTEFVGCRYNTNAGQAVTDATTIIFEDRIYDSHNAYNTSTGGYIIPTSGYYRFEANILTNSVAAGAVTQYILLNIRNMTTSLNTFGIYNTARSTTAMEHGASIAVTLYCNKGDDMHFRFTESLPAVNLSTSNISNWMSITKVS